MFSTQPLDHQTPYAGKLSQQITRRAYLMNPVVASGLRAQMVVMVEAVPESL